MSSLYKNGQYYYLSVVHNGKRITKSLGTTNINVAKLLKPSVEITILQQLNGFIESNAELSFPHAPRNPNLVEKSKLS